MKTMHTDAPKKLLIGVLTVAAIACTAGCNSKQEDYPDPSGYDFKHPLQIDLPGELAEISGIVYYPKDNSILAECDGKGCVFKIPLSNSRQIKRYKFGKNRDYEDMAVVDSFIYLLNSDGNIISLHFDDVGKIFEHNYLFPDSSGNEFEAMYYDTNQKDLVLLCKNCEDQPKNSIPTYRLNTVSGEYAAGGELSLEAMKESITDEDKLRTKPSAAAIHPVTGELYVLSSIDKHLIVFDRNKKFKQAYKLNSEIFKQPEGITFGPNGNLFISNESANSGSSNILFFQCKTSSGK